MIVKCNGFWTYHDLKIRIYLIQFTQIVQELYLLFSFVYENDVGKHEQVTTNKYEVNQHFLQFAIEIKISY